LNDCFEILKEQRKNQKENRKKEKGFWYQTRYPLTTLIVIPRKGLQDDLNTNMEGDVWLPCSLAHADTCNVDVYWQFILNNIEFVKLKKYL
jgi:hypothetical protein